MNLRILRKSVLIVLSICLSSSCRQFDRTIERCSINVIDGECYCHPYRLAKGNVGRVGNTIVYPIEYCDKLIGVHAKDYDALYEAIIRDLSAENNFEDFE